MADTRVGDAEQLERIQATIRRIEEIRTLAKSLEDAPWGDGKLGYVQPIERMLLSWTAVLETRHAQLRLGLVVPANVAQLPEPTHNIRDSEM